MKAVTKKKPVEKKVKAKRCTEKKCKLPATAYGYCRLHYVQNWKLIKLNEHTKAERRLNAYVDRMAKKFPKDYLERIKETLEDEHKFKEMVQELEIELESGPKETDDEFLEKFLRVVKPGG